MHREVEFADIRVEFSCKLPHQGCAERLKQAIAHAVLLKGNHDRWQTIEGISPEGFTYQGKPAGYVVLEIMRDGNNVTVMYCKTWSSENARHKGTQKSAA